MRTVSITQLMVASSRLPDYPIPSPDRRKVLLIDQILAFQERYLFSGPPHTREALAARSVSYLERLNDMQLFGIATSQVQDRHIGYRSS